MLQRENGEIKLLSRKLMLIFILLGVNVSVSEVIMPRFGGYFILGDIWEHNRTGFKQTPRKSHLEEYV